MESTSIGMLLKSAPQSKLDRPFSPALILAFVHLFVGTTLCLAQQSDTTPSRLATTADSRFDTPKSTTARWVESVNKQDWREEYDCYTGTQQAKFTYQVMVSTRELSDSQDLSIALSRVFQKHSFPSNLLEEFPSTRMDLSNLHDQDLIQPAIDSQHEQRLKQLDQWEREIQPLNINWSGMIGDLQPLFSLNYQCHKHDNHPSRTGIAFHLFHHHFVGPTNLKIVGNRAEGLVVAIVCDPDVVVNEDADARDPNRLKMISAWFDRAIQKLPIVDRRHKRPAEKIRLVRETDGWKIDLVPFR